MKITFEREEVVALLAAQLATRFGGEWKCVSASYNLPRDLDFEQNSPEVEARRTEEAKETERMMAEYKASHPEETKEDVPL